MVDLPLGAHPRHPGSGVRRQPVSGEGQCTAIGDIGDLISICLRLLGDSSISSIDAGMEWAGNAVDATSPPGRVAAWLPTWRNMG